MNSELHTFKQKTKHVFSIEPTVGTYFIPHKRHFGLASKTRDYNYIKYYLEKPSVVFKRMKFKFYVTKYGKKIYLSTYH